jgi:hypothetical protein
MSKQIWAEVSIFLDRSAFGPKCLWAEVSDIQRHLGEISSLWFEFLSAQWKWVTTGFTLSSSWSDQVLPAKYAGPDVTFFITALTAYISWHVLFWFITPLSLTNLLIDKFLLWVWVWTLLSTEFSSKDNYILDVRCEIRSLSLSVRVAQWLERRAQRSDDPCVGGSNPTVGSGCRSFGWDHIHRNPLSQ